MVRIPNNVLTFAQDNVDVYKAFHDYFNHYRAMQNKDSNIEYIKFDTGMKILIEILFLFFIYF